ncbi:MAG: hypothetical protein AMXMBFR61_17560 [Fimbriimonadales bacterium]
MRTIAICIALGYLVAVPALGQETYTLKRVFKEGTERKYASKAIILPARGEEYRLVVEREDVEKCVKVTPDGNAQLESRELKLTMKFNDMELPNPSEEPGTDKMLVSPRNDILKMETSNTEDDMGLRLGRAIQVVYPEKPVAVGQAWKYEPKADEKGGLRGGTADTKLLAIETVNGVQCAKLEHKYVEKPFGTDKGKVQAELTVWIDLSNGEMVKLTGKVSGMVVDMGGDDTELRMEVTGEYVPNKT